MTGKPRHRMRAVLAAAAAGGGVIGLEAALFAVWNAVLAGDTSTALFTGLVYLLFVPLMFAPLFLIGLAVVGAPMWAVLEGMAVRTSHAAVLAGSLMSTATAMVVLAVMGVLSPGALWFCAAFAPAGGAAGWVLHRVAYGRAA